LIFLSVARRSYADVSLLKKYAISGLRALTHYRITLRIQPVFIPSFLRFILTFPPKFTEHQLSQVLLAGESFTELPLIL
jgi:hypothetical protein